MADPLTTVADEFAPAPLNIFDPKLAESVISRHGNALRGAQSSEMLAKATKDSYDMEAAKRREDRDALLATREEKDFAEKQEADSKRSDLLSEIYETLRPNDEGFDERSTAFLSKAPPSILKDPTFNEVLKSLAKRADTAEEERRKVRETETRQKNANALIGERAKYSDTFRYLTPEVLKDIPRDADGNLDMLVAGMRAKELENAAKMKEYSDKKKVDTEAKIDVLEVKNMNTQQRALYDETKDILISDRRAFPNRTEIILQKAEGEGNSGDPKILIGDAKWGPELRKAQEWDKNLFDNEVLVAMEATTPEQYMTYNGVDGKPVELTPIERNRRKRVWEYAHKNDNAAPAPAPTTNAPAAPTTATPAAPTATPAAPAAPELTYTEKTLPDGTIVRRYSDGTIKQKKPQK
jgi:hypothetical protein